MTKQKPIGAALLVSYVPLLDFKKYQRFTDINNKQDAIRESRKIDRILRHTPTAEGCVWVGGQEGGSKFAPVLVIKHARKIADHLKAWADGQPTEWFTAYLHSTTPTNYVFALMPNLEKSIERWRYAYLIYTGELAPADIKFNIVFQPLSFVCAHSIVYPKMKAQITSPIFVNLLDAGDVDMRRPQETPFDKIIELGQYKLGDVTPMKGWLEDNLANAKAPPRNRKPWVNPNLKDLLQE